MGPGTVLADRYRVDELIGCGGSAEVWRARDLRLDRDVATKLLSAAAARDPVHRNRIEREARALAALPHPNVVHVYDYGEHPGPHGSAMPYIVMELVDGPDLATHLGSHGSLDIQEAVALVATVLDALADAHGMGIVHGDLKPANVYLAPQGPKVGDFGVARILSLETGDTVAAATPTYASPEVLGGERPGPAADVYSAAVVAFELLAGRPPFAGDSFSSLANQHLNDPPPHLLDVRPDVPQKLADAVHRGLSKRPEGRHPGAAAFAAALRAADTAAPGSPDERAYEQTPDAEPAAEADRRATGAFAVNETVPLVRDSTQVLLKQSRRRSAVATLTAWGKRIPAGPALAVGAVLLLALLRTQSTATAAVPELTGLQLEQAVEVAQEHGFSLETQEVDEGGVAGTVVGQDPRPGTLRPRNSTMVLSVTLGAPQVTVPDVIGLPLQDAHAQVREAGLNPGPILFHVTDIPPGRVVDTRPGPGSQVDEGSEVELVVSAEMASDGSGGSRPGRERSR